MNLHLWIGFALASLAMGLIPGPAVMSIAGYAIGSGRRTALAAVAGMAVGNVIAMSLSLAGVGALLAASALAFAIMKWAGALYLITLGILTIARSAAPPRLGPAPPTIQPRTAFTSAIAVGVFHPKTIVFYVAFVPQFISPDGNYARQATILVLTFGTIVFCTDALYALSAATASRLVKNSHAGRWAKRASGGFLIAAGVATAAAHD